MAQPNLSKIRACLFDMDGLLIDSEDLYTICTNTVLHEHGRPDLPWSIKAQLQGRPGPQAQEIFHAWAQLPITREEFYSRQTELQKEHFPKAQPLPGVLELLQRLKENGIHMALATSSHAGNFKLKSAHLPHLFSHFPDQHRILGDDKRIAPGRGKPCPDIWLLALETLNSSLIQRGETPILPSECLVFEDSVPGVESGRRAGMQVIWCPHPELLLEYKGREEEVLAGLTGEHKEGEVSAGKPGEIGDGWARLVESLERFPLIEYGIGRRKE
ncbi:HAD superfamily hydrolase [Zopfia rhizophila CBS 207.26]|uniref:HAD superfamily hydrolase n=1 Tax=Zopfia rhizophila CBS 207.26 TaxID=1314779 RepID=A0A6A6DRK5_9PEZI|nr:HAD superfamily hydrolase [Zopfia rhizophila CBS 207.26]